MFVIQSNLKGDEKWCRCSDETLCGSFPTAKEAMTAFKNSGNTRSYYNYRIAEEYTIIRYKAVKGFSLGGSNGKA